MNHRKHYAMPASLNWDYVKFKNNHLKKEFLNNIFGNEYFIHSFLQVYIKYAIRFCYSMQFQLEVKRFKFDKIVKQTLIMSDLDAKIILHDDYSTKIYYTMLLEDLFKYWKYGNKLQKWFLREYGFGDKKTLFNPKRLLE